jgi:hypothetical protein
VLPTTAISTLQAFRSATRPRIEVLFTAEMSPSCSHGLLVYEYASAVSDRPFGPILGPKRRIYTCRCQTGHAWVGA